MENTTLTIAEMEIISEYFLNGYKKLAAYEKYKPNHATRNALNVASYRFWNKEAVKEYVLARQEEIIGSRQELINELLQELKTRIFEDEVVGEYTYQSRQKDIELLIKISGIDKAPKYKDDIKNPFEDTVITINIIDNNAGDESI